MELQDFLVLATTNSPELMLELRAARRQQLALPASLHPQIARLVRSGTACRQNIISQCIRLGIQSNAQLSILSEAGIAV